MHENYRDAMKSVLGAMVMDEGAMLTALARLRLDAMVGPERKVLDSLREIASAGRAPSIVVVCDELEKLGTLEVAGGKHFVSVVTDHGCAIENIEAHCDIVNREARGRALKEVLRKSAEALQQVGVDLAIEKAEKLIREITDDEMRSDRPKMLGELLPNLLEAIEPGIATGFWIVDQFTNGLGKGWLVTVGARPGVGKTIFGVAVADYAARNGIPVMFFSMEMSANEIMRRIVSRSGLADADAAQDATLNTLPISIVPPGRYAPIHIRATMRRAKVKPRLVVVDYIQLVEAANPKDRRYEQVDQVAKELKFAAQEFGVTIIALAQVGRSVEAGGKQRIPTQADLRESGGIENASDAVILLHRADPKNNPSDAELLIDKNRHGPGKKICKLYFDERRVTFYDVEER